MNSGLLFAFKAKKRAQKAADVTTFSANSLIQNPKLPNRGFLDSTPQIQRKRQI
jgi:hypothetical protein